MKVAIAGLGLIGGSFYKAFIAAGVDVAGFDRDDPVDVADADVVIVALHPRTTVEWIAAHSQEFKDGAIVVDTCGVKRFVMDRVVPVAAGAKWIFVGGHPMAGKETYGFRNSDATLFRNATMLLIPPEGTTEQALETLDGLFRLVGFKRTMVTGAAEHDTEIAYTSQLCHIISSAYLRDPLALGFDGFSAGSFRDMIRVGAPEPKLWSELFEENKEALLPVLDRMIGRMEALRDAISAGDRDSVMSQLAEGKPIKEKINAGARGNSGKPMKGTKDWRSARRSLVARQQQRGASDEWVVPE